jgi:hypothetical protein
MPVRSNSTAGVCYYYVTALWIKKQLEDLSVLGFYAVLVGK